MVNFGLPLIDDVWNDYRKILPQKSYSWLRDCDLGNLDVLDLEISV